MRPAHVKLHVLIALLFGLFALCASDVRGQAGVDRDTQRNGMHSCPPGFFVIGVHVETNLLLCSREFGGYSSWEEIIDRSTQVQSMHACPEGMAMTGLHVGRNLLACAPVARPPIPAFVDRRNQNNSMHGCPRGNPVSGIHVSSNLLRCGTQQVEGVRDLDQDCNPLVEPPECQRFVDAHQTADLARCRREHGATARVLAPPLTARFTGTARVRTTADVEVRDVDLLVLRFTRNRCHLTITSLPTFEEQTGYGEGTFHPVSGTMTMSLTLLLTFALPQTMSRRETFSLTTGNSVSGDQRFNVTGSPLTQGGSITLVGTPTFGFGRSDYSGSVFITGNISPHP